MEAKIRIPSSVLYFLLFPFPLFLSFYFLLFPFAFLLYYYSMDIILYIIAGPLFLISLIGYIYAKFALRPKDPDLDNWYYEFEDRHPEVACYERWTKITFTSLVIAMLLIFIAAVI